MTKKVLVIECSAKSWVDIFKKLQEEIEWKPVYWTSGARYLNAETIHEIFPTAIVHENYDAIRGVPAAALAKDFLPPLEISFLKEFSYHEAIVLQMMDRMDPLDIFTHAERVRLYHTYLRYWLHVLETLEPDIFLTPCNPHLCYDYILYQLCIYKKIRCIVFVETTVPHLVYINERFENIPLSLEKKYVELLSAKQSPELSVTAQEYIEKISGNYKEALPSYMIEQFKSVQKRKEKKPMIEKINSEMRRRVGKIKNKYITGWLLENVNIYYKAEKRNIEEKTLTREELEAYEDKMKKRTADLETTYNSMISKVDFSRPYVFVALMYQPERTSSPDGGLFTYQNLMVEWLSAAIPEHWVIYVKEHPSQFIFNVDNTRKSWVYNDMLKFRNVNLISTETNTFDLIDNCKTVATLTGTIGFESVVRGKPVLSFGYAWYRGCEGVFSINKFDELKAYIKRIESGFIPEKNNVLKFVQALEEIGIKGYVDPYYEKGFDYWQNVDNFKNALVSFEKNANSSTGK